MLLAIREKVTGWIAYGIIFLISIPFALWGMNSYFEGGSAVNAAVVNGEEISIRQFDQSYSNYRQRLMQLFGGAIPESLGTESVIRAQVMDQVVQDTALRQYILEQNYRIGDAALAELIRNMTEFQIDGQFDAEIYNAQLRSIGLSPLAFEEQMRLSGAVQQFQNGLQATAFVTPSSLGQYVTLRNQTRKLRTLTYLADTGANEPSPGEVEAYYQENAERFRTEEQVRIDYIEVGLDAIKESILVSDADVEARYRDNLASYSAPEYRDASHILIEINDETDEATALATISDIRQRIVNGEDFAALAAEFSNDPLSAEAGGSLGEVGRGDMVPSFETALFALETGELSEPVKTGFGWHLIRVDSISGGDVQSLESLRADLADEIKTEMAEVQIYELVESLSNIAYEQPDSLLPASDQSGLPVQSSDWFGRSAGEGIATDARIRQAAFADDTLVQGLNSEAIELDGERVVFLRVLEQRPAQTQPLEQVREQVISELTRQKLAEASTSAGIAALERLRAGATLEDIAAEWGGSVEDLGFVERNQADQSPTIVQAGFTMPKPEDGLTFDGLVSSSGEYTLIELSAVVSSDGSTDPGLKQGLQRNLGGSQYQAAVGYLASRSEVFITPLDEIEDAYVH